MAVVWGSYHIKCVRLYWGPTKTLCPVCREADVIIPSEWPQRGEISCTNTRLVSMKLNVEVYYVLFGVGLWGLIDTLVNKWLGPTAYGLRSALFASIFVIAAALLHQAHR